MHISEGILSAPVLIGGATASGIGVALGLKRMRHEAIPKTAVLPSAFFVVSLLHVPIGPANAHLVMNGLLGIALGWCAFPAVLVALALQALFFQFGGFTSLGVNALNMALPALAASWLYRGLTRGRRREPLIAFACGFLGVFGASLMMFLCLASTAASLAPLAQLIILAHLPLALIEGVVTVIAVAFIRKTLPDLIDGIH